jgi:uncharacterized membrane protein
MLYEKAFAIERRLGDLVRMIRSGHHSAPKLARELGVSEPTVWRSIAALKQRGYSIRSVKYAKTWAYELLSEPAAVSHG